MTDAKHPRWALPFWIVVFLTFAGSTVSYLVRGESAPLWYYAMGLMAGWFAVDAWKKRKGTPSD